MQIIKMMLGSIATNCYILIDDATKKAAVIDPAECSAELLDVLKSNDISSVDYILLTHGHFDHILGVSKLKKIYKDAKVAIHLLDADCLFDPNKSMASTSEYANEIQEPLTADIILNDNDEFNLGEIGIKVLHTPGHTKGSICLICEDIIISGDTLFCKTVGRTDFEGGSMQDMLQSLKKLGNLKGDYAVYPGHNRETTLNEEREHNRYMRKMKWS
ncbi:MAG: MBL fold metallo-hydrolase [Oscillospiraceae bacterium]